MPGDLATGMPPVYTFYFKELNSTSCAPGSQVCWRSFKGLWLVPRRKRYAVQPLDWVFWLCADAAGVRAGALLPLWRQLRQPPEPCLWQVGPGSHEGACLREVRDRTGG